MSEIRFTKDHEYVRVDGDVGVGRNQRPCAAAAGRRGLRRIAGGRRQARTRAQPAAVVESVKAASDVFAPVSGEVVAVNSEVDAEPGLINEDALGRGWLFRIKLADPDELDALMDESDYAAYPQDPGLIRHALSAARRDRPRADARADRRRRHRRAVRRHSRRQAARRACSTMPAAHERNRGRARADGDGGAQRRGRDRRRSSSAPAPIATTFRRASIT